ncbi:MAG: hypothetical protein V2I54_12070 [Bacteroidales bacterium]|jgi:hypothetical protein|nr:hypothetical protein [Bacteroidales bacterium]
MPKVLKIVAAILLLSACDNLELSTDQQDVFVKYYGSWNTDAGNDIVAFGEGYLVLTTMTSARQNTEIVLLHTNKFGNIFDQGIDTLSSVRGGNNTASSLLTTRDGGIVILGTVTDTLNDNTDIYVQKLNSDLSNAWENILGDEANQTGAAIQPVADGFIIAGSTDASDVGNGNSAGKKDVFLVKIDSEGAVEWSKNYGGSGDEFAADILSTDQGFMILGTTNGFHEPGQANNNIILIKTNLSGGAPDMATFGGSNNDFGAALVKASEEGFVLLGTVENVTGSSSNVYVVKISEDIHQTAWEYITEFPSRGLAMINSEDNYCIAGSKQLAGGSAAYFLKLTPAGEKLTENSYGGYGQSINSLTATFDSGYIMTGTSGVPGNEKILLIKVNNHGDL